MKNQVLIIDSDVEMSKKIKYSLQDENTNVYYTASVKEALRLFASHTYAMVTPSPYGWQENRQGGTELE